MEHKSILSLKRRMSEMEKQHNRLTSLVISVISTSEQIKRRLRALEERDNNLNDNLNDSDIQQIINQSKDDSDSRTTQLLEELKKAQLNS